MLNSLFFICTSHLIIFISLDNDSGKFVAIIPSVAKKLCNFDQKTVLQKLLYPLILKDIINTLSHLSSHSNDDLLHSWNASVFHANGCDERSNFFFTEYLRPIKDEEENEYEPGDHYSPRDRHGWKHYFHTLLDLYLSYIENCDNFPAKECKSIKKEVKNRERNLNLKKLGTNQCNSFIILRQPCVNLPIVVYSGL